MTNQELWEIVNRKRLWMTAEEFLVQVEAHKAARLNQSRLPRKPFQPGPYARAYRLNPNLKYTPGLKMPAAQRLEVAV